MSTLTVINQKEQRYFETSDEYFQNILPWFNGGTRPLHGLLWNLGVNVKVLFGYFCIHYFSFIFLFAHLISLFFHLVCYGRPSCWFSYLRYIWMFYSPSNFSIWYTRTRSVVSNTTHRNVNANVNNIEFLSGQILIVIHYTFIKASSSPIVAMDTIY